jgi:molybdopterin molybdotransferase
MIKVEEARDNILNAVNILPAAAAPLLECLGSYLAEDIVSGLDIPPFDNSAMDGYALRAADIVDATSSSPARLKVLEDLPAGFVAVQAVAPGQAIRIMTGAPMPQGADTVVPVEDSGKDGEWVLINRDLPEGRNVRRAGEDIRTGDAVLAAGTCIGPAELGVLSSLGVAEPLVHRRPVAVIISTGDELVPVGEALKPGKIRDSNSYTLFGLAREAGAKVIRVGIVGDDADLLRRAILDNLERADLFITSGGVSVGDYDMVKEVLADLGHIDFWKVNMRPGKPQAFGLIEGKPLFGLPGNPVSVMVSFEQLVRPALKKMMGAREIFRPMVEAEVEEPMGRSTGRVEFIRVVLREEDGRFKVRPTGPQGSGILRSMVLGHGLAVLGEEVGRLEPGDRVPVQLLKVEPAAWNASGAPGV